MNSVLQRWLRISFFNFLLVALAGLLLRYKIAFPLPQVNQKYLLHGHSHFAFAGWISQALMILMIHVLDKHTHGFQPVRYQPILVANQLSALGMLLSFPVQGYGPVSIFFSTCTILVSWIFAWVYWLDLRRTKKAVKGKPWLIASLVFNLLSALGVFAIAFIMSSGRTAQPAYLAAVYFYLHFQYNGWFIFACTGIAISCFPGTNAASRTDRWVFLLWVLACPFTYFLSASWIKLPIVVQLLVPVAAIAQVAGWVLLLRKKLVSRLEAFPAFVRRLLWIVAFAMSVKLLLQAASAIPSLNEMVFGYRSIVIAYLHLVMLGIVSLFIITAVLAEQGLILRSGLRKSITALTAGIVLNEIILMLQGAAGLVYADFSTAPYWLLFAALLMVLALGTLNFQLTRSPGSAIETPVSTE
jgi:hypothetical protein